ncbi:MAG: cupin domain-containing protein [Gemmatimonadetes bacterium]|nr:cupin domain-containing protein [Gemmatimonadota bacterium]
MQTPGAREHGHSTNAAIAARPAGTVGGTLGAMLLGSALLGSALLGSALLSSALLSAMPAAAAAQGGSPSGNQGAAPTATNFTSPGGLKLKLLFGDAGIGPEVSLGELTFPPNMDSGDHAHGSTEVLYVLSGELEHTVDGMMTVLKPGMAGFVRPPAKIRHKTGPAGAKVLVVWAPAEEAARIAARWKREP